MINPLAVGVNYKGIDHWWLLNAEFLVAHHPCLLWLQARTDPLEVFVTGRKLSVASSFHFIAPKLQYGSCPSRQYNLQRDRGSLVPSRGT